MKREDQQDATIRCLLLNSVSTCFGHHYAQLQENKGSVTAFGVLFWFCWMWLVAVVGRCLVGCEHCVLTSYKTAPHNLPLSLYIYDDLCVLILTLHDKVSPSPFSSFVSWFFLITYVPIPRRNVGSAIISQLLKNTFYPVCCYKNKII